MAVVAVAAAALLLASGSAAIAVITAKSGTTVTRTAITTENSAAVFSGGAFVTIGSSGVFAGAGSHILVTFSAEVACFGGNGWCSVRILVDGAEADPVAGLDFAFDSTNNGTETFSSWESHSMQRSRTVATTGFHPVVVQVAHVGVGVQSRFDDWTISTLAIAP